METLIKTRIGTTTTVSISFANLPAGCTPAVAILDSSKAAIGQIAVGKNHHRGVRPRRYLAEREVL